MWMRVSHDVSCFGSLLRYWTWSKTRGERWQVADLTETIDCVSACGRYNQGYCKGSPLIKNKPDVTLTRR